MKTFFKVLVVITKIFVGIAGVLAIIGLGEIALTGLKNNFAEYVRDVKMVWDDHTRKERYR